MKTDTKVLENSKACSRFLTLNGIKQHIKEFIPLERQGIVIERLI